MRFRGTARLAELATVLLLVGDGPVELELVNAREVKNAPGRPETDLDAVWLAMLAACGMLRARFVAAARDPPAPG
jgi:hypothetical protein